MTVERITRERIAEIRALAERMYDSRDLTSRMFAELADALVLEQERADKYATALKETTPMAEDALRYLRPGNGVTYRLYADTWDALRKRLDANNALLGAAVPVGENAG